jgi:hypothetical protein
MAEDANTPPYENVWVQTQNLNVRMLPPYAVTLLDLSMESDVNGGNKTAQRFSVKILSSFHALQQQIYSNKSSDSNKTANCNKCCDSNTTNSNVIIFQCDNTVRSHTPQQ